MEGITWLLDFLPSKPQKAIDVVNDYFSVHCLYLPDNSIHGLGDAATLIRAKYINYQHPKDVFLTISPNDFELLVKHLYSLKGYKTILTQQTRDGGRDIIAEKKGRGGVEKLVIQCKRYTKNVTVKEVREFSGVIQNYPLNYHERITKGVMVSSSGFTSAVLKEFSKDHSLEFIDSSYLGDSLTKLAGKYWAERLDKILFSEKKME